MGAAFAKHRRKAATHAPSAWRDLATTAVRSLSLLGRAVYAEVLSHTHTLLNADTPLFIAMKLLVQWAVVARHLLSIADLEQADFQQLIRESAGFARDSHSTAPRLARRCIGVYFRKPSTRTRTSFIVGTVRLGGFPVVYGPADLQVSTGESIGDTVRVLSGYLDALVIRSAADAAELRTMAAIDRLPIVNAMTADEHPTQAISDLAMLTRHFGTLEGLRLLYAGEGNNTAASLALAVSRVAGMELVLLTPQGYGLAPAVSRCAAALAQRFGGRIAELHEIPARAEPFDVLYTTRWQTTGTEKHDPIWRERFAPFRVDQAMMGRFGDPSRTVFMHDLPAVRGEDCDTATIDGRRSIAFEQAHQKLYTAMAVLDWCIQP
jgi:ornithine carbamoyltransferase